MICNLLLLIKLIKWWHDMPNEQTLDSVESYEHMEKIKWQI